MIEFRKPLPADHEAIWEISQKVIAKADSFVFNPGSSKEKLLSFWFAADRVTWVAIINGVVGGIFFIKANQPDLGSHIANGAYMVSPDYSGNGIGRIMGEFSIFKARELGYSAMQFNFVIKTNTAAVRLWQKIGFKIIGEIPEAFNHRQFGLTNAYIMYLKL